MLLSLRIVFQFTNRTTLARDWMIVNDELNENSGCGASGLSSGCSAITQY